VLDGLGAGPSRRNHTDRALTAVVDLTRAARPELGTHHRQMLGEGQRAGCSAGGIRIPGQGGGAIAGDARGCVRGVLVERLLLEQSGGERIEPLPIGAE
jgi:hypothetical protein